mmetsp:Transcript_3481/g.4883  ORF Transcript_3481/g.4883 Transcript_3481/m.4883 type:complete len:87 (-) Transcript_3481:2740-3000(-)
MRKFCLFFLSFISKIGRAQNAAAIQGIPNQRHVLRSAETRRSSRHLQTNDLEYLAFFRDVVLFRIFNSWPGAVDGSVFNSFTEFRY